ncbi:hypothetical protein [Sphingorhabdus sp. EL138]|uniref:hypothetical protein n=1 Tax=Sphingorhabdus sp. EL138 TaxID=2073156 RepID=UPI0025F35A79|nr:hypothetical protein [Sphingorhabdus sp. EL138]
MRAAARPVTLIDINPQTIDRSGDFGFKVFTAMAAASTCSSGQGAKTRRRYSSALMTDT